MSNIIKIKKGKNITLKGKADRTFDTAKSKIYAVKPADFHNIIPKLLVKVGDKVKAGSHIFYEKYTNKIKFSSPVSGEIKEIERGAKRKIQAIKIIVDEEISYKKIELKETNRNEIIDTICESGLWPLIKQRPYDIIANPTSKPKNIFISAFNTNPLSANKEFILYNKSKELQKGIDIISKLTEGKVHFNLHIKKNFSEIFKNIKNVQKNIFSGPNPSGNVGVQINKIAPINKGEIIWTISPEAVAQIGTLFLTGKYDASKIISVGGSEFKNPRYYKVIQGVCVNSIIKDKLKSDNVRIISGNPLVGEKIEQNGFLGFYHSSINVLPEGNKNQFFGWLAPNFNKLSLNRSYFSWLNPTKKYKLNTNTNGEPRAIVITGQYDNLFPMDIYPQQLIKAVICKDIELMENLGIFEVAPEDFALAEFACTSKLPIQNIIREGLDLMQKEVG